MAQLGDLVRAKALLRSAARAFGPKEAVARAQVRRRRGRDRTRLARPGLACEGARRGAGDARSARRPRKCRACAESRSPAPAPDRPPRRGRARRSPSSTPRPSRPRRGPPTSWWLRGSRFGACGRRRRALRSLGPSTPRAQADIPALTAEVESAFARPEHARGAPDRAWRGATPPARGCRSAAGVEGARRGRVPPCRA